MSLCFFPGFDVKDDPDACPSERNALKELYDSLRGSLWKNSNLWVHPYESHCSWSGVVCNERGKTTQLLLHNNGLFGTLSQSIARLSSLEKLDLSNNAIQVIDNFIKKRTAFRSTVRTSHPCPPFTGSDCSTARSPLRSHGSPALLQ